MLRTTSCPTSNLTATDKRLSLISSETDSSASSGFCDTVIHNTEEEGASAKGSTVTVDSRVSSKSQPSPRGHRRKKSMEEVPNKVTREIEKGNEKRNKHSKSPSPEEEKKSSNFFRSFSLRDRSSSDRADRERAASPEECGGGVVFRRSVKDKDSNHGPHKRRSLIERITHKHSDDKAKDKEKTRRRSLVETCTVSLDTKTDGKENTTDSTRNKQGIKPKSNCVVSEVSSGL